MHAWLSAVQHSMTTEAVSADITETHSTTEPLVLLLFFQLFHIRVVGFVIMMTIVIMATVIITEVYVVHAKAVLSVCWPWDQAGNSTV